MADTLAQQVAAFSEQGAGPDYARLHIVQLAHAYGSISYFEFGDPNGTPLLCLHGLSVSGLFFEQFHQHFIAVGVRAIAPNLLGGIYVPDSRKTIDSLASEVIALLDALGIATCDMLGFSWGTLPQLALLARIPGRIGKAGLLGAMTPLAFVDDHTVKLLKSDVQLTLKMVARTPFLHRGLMWLFCKLPVAKLIEQFKDEQLSAQELQALTVGTAFHAHFARSLAECLRSGAQFFTDGWRMFLDQPDYALKDLAQAAPLVDVRLYVAGNDNVHLPHFSEVIAAACASTEIGELKRDVAQARSGKMQPERPCFHQVYAKGKCSIWMMEGAGRVACMLYFTEALYNLMGRGTAVR